MPLREFLALIALAFGIAFLGAYGSAYGAERCITPKDNAKTYGPPGRSWYGEDAEIFLDAFAALVGEKTPWEFKIWGVTLHQYDDAERKPHIVAKMYGDDGCDVGIGANLTPELIDALTAIIGRRV